MHQGASNARIHLDTDLGGDPDDVCALAMLLGWSGVGVGAITTTIDPSGERAGCVAHCLRLAGREDIPVVAGMETSLTTARLAHPAITDERYWPRDIEPLPSPPGAALERLARSIEDGLTVIAIGPLTNLARLELSRPGALARARVVAMGGWIEPATDGLPPWGPEKDWNMQWDTQAAELVASTADLTLVPLPVTLKAQLRARELPRLRASGPLGRFLARQSEARRDDAEMTELARSHAGLADDLVNFHHDPVTCAVALRWPGAALHQMKLRPALDKGLLRFVPSTAGRLTDVVVDFDGRAFTAVWLDTVAATSSSAGA